jgi:hypothetical protein
MTRRLEGVSKLNSSDKATSLETKAHGNVPVTIIVAR